ncbi:hypothetical protein [Microbacterium timonense]|uniref:hypothetical protein n=1 Tax=Microbacterium timonense TaxID=2086576 RepID=UPI000D0F615B|nr:hypothetical protein [Microbacterium timonense]
MGLFSQRPEETNEWAGLPSEPARPQTAAERLADAAPVDVVGLGPGDLGTGAVESIVIPVKPVVEIAESRDTGADG